MYTSAQVPSSKLRVAEVSHVLTGISMSNVNVVIREEDDEAVDGFSTGAPRVSSGE